MRAKKLLAGLVVVASAALAPVAAQAGSDFHFGLHFGQPAQPMPVQATGHYVWDGYRYVWVNDAYTPYRRYDYAPYGHYRRDYRAPTWVPEHYTSRGRQPGYWSREPAPENPGDANNRRGDRD